MAESRAESGAQARDRRSFLKKAGVVAGAAWVAPAVWSGPAAAQGSPGGGPGGEPIPLPIPPFGLGPFGLGTFGGISWQGRTLEPVPGVWQVTYIPNLAIELLALQLVNPNPATVVGAIAPTPGPGALVPAGGQIVINGVGATPQAPSFFDVFVTLQ